LAVVVLFLVFRKTNGTIASSGEQRRYLLYVPKSYNPATPTPLVISRAVPKHILHFLARVLVTPADASHPSWKS
jgi:hypothetical protein